MAGEGAVALADFARARSLELTRFAYLITGDRGRSEDLVQEVFLSMHRRFGSRVTIDDPLSYARRAIVNAQVSWVRRIHLVELPSERVPELPSWDDGVGNSGAGDRVWDALVELPARQRAVLVLRYYVGHNDREIADLLSCRESSVRSLAARAFKTLRGVLRGGNSGVEVAREHA